MLVSILKQHLTNVRALEDVIKIASIIASKNSHAIRVAKQTFLYSRDHSVQEGLNQVALWNSAVLQSSPFATAKL